MKERVKRRAVADESVEVTFYVLAALMRLVLPIILGPSTAIHLSALIGWMSSSIPLSYASSFGVYSGFGLKKGKLDPLKYLTPLSKRL